jgi:predicted negative regulator of RcsB-dependent stress response
MSSVRLRLIALCASLLSTASAMSADDPLKDLYFGEALFYAHQGYYFEALERLDAELGQHYGLDEPSLDSLHQHLRQAEFSVGDFELNYRMHHRAGRAITAVLEGGVDESIRNEAAYRLAKIHFEKGQLTDALRALARIEGRVPAGLRNDIDFLRANIYLATGRSTDAEGILKRLQRADELSGFAEYNLAIAFLREGRADDALTQLERAGQVKATDDSTRAIRDKANLVRGTLLLESGAFETAKRSFEQVRLEGPFSNQALLKSGWADVSADRFARAVVPWNILVKRNSTDPSVQEAMLALPYAYSQLDVHGRAAVLYGQALGSFGGELEKLNTSISSIRDGKFLEALSREEIRVDKDWVIQLRSLPEAPETYYLMELLASHDFQTALQNYLDLGDLYGKLNAWQRGFAAFEDIIRARRAYYEPLLPGLDQHFRKLDSRRRLRLEQHRILAERLQGMLVAPRPDFLATAEERTLMDQLAEMVERLGLEPEGPEARLLERVQRLRGLITWDLKTEYHERLTRFYEHLEESQEAVDFLTEQYNAFIRVRQAATHSYVGYEVPIRRLRTRVVDAIARIDLLMARQGHMLEQVAVNELQIRVRRLEGFEDQARYALADSYDRATKAQSQAEFER